MVDGGGLMAKYGKSNPDGGRSDSDSRRRYAATGKHDVKDSSGNQSAKYTQFLTKGLDTALNVPVGGGQVAASSPTVARPPASSGGGVVTAGFVHDFMRDRGFLLPGENVADINLALEPETPAEGSYADFMKREGWMMPGESRSDVVAQTRTMETTRHEVVKLPLDPEEQMWDNINTFFQPATDRVVDTGGQIREDLDYWAAAANAAASGAAKAAALPSIAVVALAGVAAILLLRR